MSNQRGFFRLDYPEADRPTLVFDHHSYPVLDISEKGCKFLLTKDLRIEPDTQISGTVRFQSGKSVAVKGVVIRVLPLKRECVVELSVGVPLAMMMDEQRRLIQKYKPTE